MSEHTKIDYQIIEQGGKPVFAVVPYDQFKAFIDNEDDSTIPHEVARAVVVDDKSMLKAWREHLNLSQSELASKAGMTQPAIAQLENSSSDLRESTLKKIASAMGIDSSLLREL